MKTQQRILAIGLAATTLMAAALSAHAQTASGTGAGTSSSASGAGTGTGTSSGATGTGTSSGAMGTGSSYRAGAAGQNRTSWLPYTTNGYVGASVGWAEYNNSCGAGGFNCDDPDVSGHVYTGGMFTPYLGAEIGYVHIGEADRAGGTTRAKGVNLSLIGRLPISPVFHAYGKLGTTYGWTKVSANAASGVTTGKEEGWGLAYGLGVGYDFAPNWTAILEWQRHDFNFAGDSRREVDMANIGIKYRF